MLSLIGYVCDHNIKQLQLPADFTELAGCVLERSIEREIVRVDKVIKSLTPNPNDIAIVSGKWTSFHTTECQR
jgi:hypothetical protein